MRGQLVLTDPRRARFPFSVGSCLLIWFCNCVLTFENVEPRADATLSAEFSHQCQSTTSTEGSPSPAALNAPRYGTVVPKRIFVGGISANTTEAELHELFSHYGVVTNTKIISDRAGVSKGYGFVTFDTEEEAQRAQLSASNLMLRDRRLNVAPAIKKQPFARVYAVSAQGHDIVAGSPSDPTQSVPNGTVLYHNGIPYTYHNGMAFFITPEAMYQYAGQASSAATAAAPPAYPVIYQPSVYYPQQPYQYQNVVPPQWTTGGSPWRWTPSQNPSGQAPPGAYGYAAPVASGASAHLGSGGGPDSPEYRDPAIVEASAEHSGLTMAWRCGRPQGPRPPPPAPQVPQQQGGNVRPRMGPPRNEGLPRCSPPGYASGGTSPRTSSCSFRSGPSGQSVGSGDTQHPQRAPGASSRPPHHLSVMVPKVVNGVAVLACPKPVSLGRPRPSGTAAAAGGSACSTSPRAPPARASTQSAPKGAQGGTWPSPGTPTEALGDSLRGLGL